MSTASREQNRHKYEVINYLKAVYAADAKRRGKERRPINIRITLNRKFMLFGNRTAYEFATKVGKDGWFAVLCNFKRVYGL